MIGEFFSHLFQALEHLSEAALILLKVGIPLLIATLFIRHMVKKPAQSGLMVVYILSYVACMAILPSIVYFISPFKPCWLYFLAIVAGMEVGATQLDKLFHQIAGRIIP